MFRIDTIIMVVMVFAVAQSKIQQPSPDVAPYLRSFAKRSSYAFNCSSDEAYRIRNVFECGDGWCLDEDVDVCDSIINCPNFADETPDMCADRPGGWKDYCDEVEGVPKRFKLFEYVKCGNGMCISECDVCDGQFLDCSDYSDEINCNGQGPDPGRCATYNRLKRAVRRPDF